MARPVRQADRVRPWVPDSASRLRDDSRGIGCVLLALAVAGCAPEMGVEAPPSVSATATATTFALPLRMVGTEPFWGGTITGEAITLEGADRPAVRFPAGEPVVAGTGARWRTRSADGGTLDLNLVDELFSYGMSDSCYYFAVYAVLSHDV